MRSSLIAFMGLVSAAHAQGYPEHASADTLTIETDGSAAALVTYSNSGSHNSLNVRQVMQAGDIRVEVEIDVGGGNGSDELFIVRPLGGFIAVPDRVSVPDGEQATIRVMLPMY